MKKLHLFLIVTTLSVTFHTEGMRRPGHVSQAVWRLMTADEKRAAIAEAQREPAVWQIGYPGPKRLVRPQRRPQRPVVAEWKRELQKFREEKKRKENLLALSRRKLQSEKRRLTDGMRFLDEAGRREIRDRIDRLRDTIKRLEREIRTMRPPRPLIPYPPQRRRRITRYVGRPFVGTPIEEEEARRLIKRRPEALERLEAQERLKIRRQEAARLLQRLREDWPGIKNLWHTTLSERERMFLWPRLSDAQKEELEIEGKMAIINEIEEKLYTENKNISKEEWQEAREASKAIPKFNPDISALLKNPIWGVLIAAKYVDNIERKLYSAEKDIQEEEWEWAQIMSSKIPTYKPNIGKILSRCLIDTIQIAKEIDEVQRIAQTISPKKALATLKKLPEYKNYLRKTIYEFHPELEWETLRKIGKQIKISRKKKKRWQAEAPVTLLEEDDSEEEEEGEVLS